MWFTGGIADWQDIVGNRTSPRIIAHCTRTVIVRKRHEKAFNTTHRSEMVIIDYEILDATEVVQTGRKGTMERVVADI